MGNLYLACAGKFWLVAIGFRRGIHTLHKASAVIHNLHACRVNLSISISDMEQEIRGYKWKLVKDKSFTAYKFVSLTKIHKEGFYGILRGFVDFNCSYPTTRPILQAGILQIRFHQQYSSAVP